MNLFENLQIYYESDEIDNKIFTPGSDDEKDYENSQANKQANMSTEEEFNNIHQSLKFGLYNVKCNNRIIVDNKNQPKNFNLLAIQGFINTQKKHKYYHNLNTMIIIDGDKEYTIANFNNTLEKYGIRALRV